MARLNFIIMLSLVIFLIGCGKEYGKTEWNLNDKEYLDKPGLSVLAFHDFYPTGSQGGIEIIQHGERIAANGFIRMQPVDGKRIPDPLGALREIDSANQVIKSVVSYKDFGFKYAIRIWPDGNSIHLAVDLDKPLPKEWEKKLTFDLNFFPPLYVGKSWQVGESFGYIPKQALGSKFKNADGILRPVPMGKGNKLTLAAEDPMRKVVIENPKSDLIVTDNRSTGYGNCNSVSPDKRN